MKRLFETGKSFVVAAIAVPIVLLMWVAIRLCEKATGWEIIVYCNSPDDPKQAKHGRK